MFKKMNNGRRLIGCNESALWASPTWKWGLAIVPLYGAITGVPSIEKVDLNSTLALTGGQAPSGLTIRCSSSQDQSDSSASVSRSSRRTDGTYTDDTSTISNSSRREPPLLLRLLSSRLEPALALVFIHPLAFCFAHCF